MALTGVGARLRNAAGIRRTRTKPVRAGAESRLKRMQKKRLKAYRYERLRGSLLGNIFGVKDPYAMDRMVEESTRRGRPRSGGGGGLGEDITLPPMEEAKPVITYARPTISVLIKQMDWLSNVANQIGAAMRRQQDAMVAKANVARQSEEESILESREDAIRVSSQGSEGSDNLQPVATAVDRLNNSIDDLSESIDDMDSNNNNGSWWERLLGGGKGGKGGGKWSNILKGSLAVAGAGVAGYGAYKVADSFFGSAGGVTGSSILSKLAEPNNTPEKNASKNAASSVTSPSQEKINTTATIGKALKSSLKTASDRVNAEKNITPDSVQKMAKPLLQSYLQDGSLGEIPISGDMNSISDVLNKIVSGNAAGAGVDPASGMIPPLQALPAAATSIANDLYKKIYGISPEQDPLGAQRLQSLRGGVDESLKDILKPKIKPLRKTGEEGDAERVVDTGPPGGSAASSDASANQQSSTSEQSVPTGTGNSADSALQNNSATGDNATLVNTSASSNQGGNSSSSSSKGGDAAAVNKTDASISMNNGGSSTASSNGGDAATAVNTGTSSAGSSSTGSLQMNDSYPESTLIQERMKLINLSEEQKRRKLFGRLGNFQAAISKTNLPSVLPSSIKYSQEGVLSGMGNVPDVDFIGKNTSINYYSSMYFG